MKSEIVHNNKFRSSSKGRVVEVMQLMPAKKKVNSKLTKKRRISSSLSRKKRHQIEKNDFRLALKLKKKILSQQKQTPVLCLLESGLDFYYFAGNVTALVDNYARIHFNSTSREDDIWMEIDSEMLFLDGGSCDKP